ncbi:glycoside hydrolase family 43 protein [Desertivirga arenae]|uniref:glycoside hydrolase family 43 protein n=1 Tax=Desertivirga arenae TaxID=2810309 RepID=UPI001A974F07|nr:glycoside hydrolase family 43 protein [Pedobacter sp. SYSU D00823]
MKKGIWLLLVIVISLASCSKEVYMFTSFHEPANQGLRFLYSNDGKHWKDLNKTYLKPAVGQQKVMRDPSIVKGPDGTFHFVWTSSWKGDRGFGYASSKDLVHWSEQKFIPVMENEPTTVNVWAPELFYDDVAKQYIIVWASCIPFRFPKGQEDEDNNHRLYYTTTKDFKTFSPSKLFLDPGFSAIDAVIVKRKANDYVLVVKDNTRPNRNIKIGFSNSPLGPYPDISAPFSPNFTEGPAVAKIGDEYIVYFDSYREKKYGRLKTKDFIHFSDAEKETSVPEGHKHGTVFKASRKVLKGLQKSAGIDTAKIN